MRDRMNMSEVLGFIVDLWRHIFLGIGILFLAFTSPLWIIPYIIYSKIKYDVWF